MVAHATDADPQWSHLVYLYGSVEALVFAAVGAMFGTTVQRARVEKAEEDTSAAESDLRAATLDAQWGRGMFAAFIAEAESRGLVIPEREQERDDDEYTTERVGGPSTPSGNAEADQILRRLLLMSAALRKGPSEAD
jgi:hypothetical protein